MARQSGIIKLKGTIGDITFYKSKDGYLARQKGGVEKERFLNDPKFQRTRENAAEFGRAGKASKTLCTAIRPVLNRTQDSRMISRLVQAMMRVIKADQVSDRGLRNVLDGELILLQGFDFNGNAPLGATVYAPFTASIDRAAGVLEVDIPGFVPDSQVVAPRGTTHFRLVSAGAEVDFEQETFVLAQRVSEEIPFDNSMTADINLSHDLGVTGSEKPLFLVLGIEFLQEVNGEFYALNNGAFNALNLVAVDTGVDGDDGAGPGDDPDEGEDDDGSEDDGGDGGNPDDGTGGDDDGSDDDDPEDDDETGDDEPDDGVGG